MFQLNVLTRRVLVILRPRPALPVSPESVFADSATTRGAAGLRIKCLKAQLKEDAEGDAGWERVCARPLKSRSGRSRKFPVPALAPVNDADGWPLCPALGRSTAEQKQAEIQEKRLRGQKGSLCRPPCANNGQKTFARSIRYIQIDLIHHGHHNRWTFIGLKSVRESMASIDSGRRFNKSI